jgi:hypothetical protein
MKENYIQFEDIINLVENIANKLEEPTKPLTKLNQKRQESLSLINGVK